MSARQYPGTLTPADVTNLSEVDAMDKVWRVIATHADSDSITYSVKAWPLP